MNIFDVYPVFDITPTSAKDVYVFDDKGNRYLDFYGGHAVISIGHSHPSYVKALNEQLQKIAFYSNSVKIPQQQELADKLGELSGYNDYAIFMCNSGAEANENAFKLASFHTGKKKIIAFSKSFHGRTSLAIAATNDPSIQAPVNQTDNILFLPLNDHQALEKAFDDSICAVIVEGIQGVGGVVLPTTEFLQNIQQLCQQHNAVLILDEIQSGYGRSGHFFAHQAAGIKPDLITIAKGMGNGFPVAGVLINPKFKAKHSLLGTTFGGNYLACAAAIAVLDVIKAENLIQNAKNMGNYMIEELKKNKAIKEVRGMGLMIGIEFEIPAATIRNELLKTHRIFTGSASNKNTVRLLPPLTIKKEHVDEFINALQETISAVH